MLEDEKDGAVLSQEDLVWLLYDELQLAAAQQRESVSEQDRTLIAQLSSVYLADLRQRFILSEEDQAAIDELLGAGRGYVSLDDCREFLER